MSMCGGTLIHNAKQHETKQKMIYSMYHMYVCIKEIPARFHLRAFCHTVTQQPKIQFMGNILPFSNIFRFSREMYWTIVNLQTKRNEEREGRGNNILFSIWHIMIGSHASGMCFQLLLSLKMVIYLPLE